MVRDTEWFLRGHRASGSHWKLSSPLHHSEVACPEAGKFRLTCVPFCISISSPKCCRSVSIQSRILIQYNGQRIWFTAFAFKRDLKFRASIAAFTEGSCQEQQIWEEARCCVLPAFCWSAGGWFAQHEGRELKHQVGTRSSRARFCPDQFGNLVKSLPSSRFLLFHWKKGMEKALGSREHEKNKLCFLFIQIREKWHFARE